MTAYNVCAETSLYGRSVRCHQGKAIDNDGHRFRQVQKEKHMKSFIVCLLALVAASGFTQDVPKEYANVMPYLGKNGDFKANVLKVNIPRRDLKVRVPGTDVPTPFGFGGWIAMTTGDKGMNVMMGDLVLLQDEVNPVM